MDHRQADRERLVAPAFGSPAGRVLSDGANKAMAIGYSGFTAGVKEDDMPETTANFVAPDFLALTIGIVVFFVVY